MNRMKISWKSIVGVLGLAVLWNEWLCLQLVSYHWNSPDIHSLRILIVADPQLIGYQNENAIFGPIIRWDADRFLNKGFERALSMSMANGVIFLGDLFDEGDFSPADFDATKHRFDSVFHSVNDLKMALYISGDNDVGGELTNLINSDLEGHFRQHFPQKITSIGRWGSINFNHGENNRGRLDIRPLTNNLHANLTILLSHQPVLPIAYGNKYAFDPRAPFILSAHDHKARLNKIIENDRYETKDLGTEAIMGEIRPKLELIEIQTPTCSYRMGTFDTGYGVLELTGNHFRYYVFWLPNRFLQLGLYIFALLICLILLICNCLKANKRRRFMYRVFASNA